MKISSKICGIWQVKSSLFPTQKRLRQQSKTNWSPKSTAPLIHKT